MLLLVSAALANGLTSHVTICMDALTMLPEGELRDFMTDPEMEDAIRNGTQFPDGGYAVGDDYGEIAHWEPFQQHFREWFVGEYSEPWDEDAAKLVAFNYGESCHGMGDQIFDSLFMERSKVYDVESDWASLSMDQATDVALSAGRGGQPTPGEYLPTDVLIPRFEELGHPVTADVLESGQLATNVAVLWVAGAGQNPDAVKEYHDNFPWASEHILDHAIAGNPWDESIVVARYWQILWARMHPGDAEAKAAAAEFEPVMYTFPQDGGLGHVADSTKVESRVTIAFSRAIVSALMSPQFFTVEDRNGNDVQVDTWLFYGEGSHVVHLIPARNWVADMDYTVTVQPGVAFIDGTTTTEPYSFSFSTRKPVDEVPAEAPEANADCGCHSQARGGVGVASLLALAMLVLRRRG